jgi:uncharacterized protein (TIGR02145 family)
MDAPTGSIFAFSTAPGSLAADGEGRNSIYTKHLIRNMVKPGLKIEEVLKDVRVAVVSETSGRQVPWESSSLLGSFYFKPGSEGSSTIQAANATTSAPDSSYEILFWESIKDSENPHSFAAYLEQFPDGVFARLANLRVKELAAKISTEKTAASSQQSVSSPLEKPVVKIAPQTKMKSIPASANSRPTAAKPSTKTCGAYTSPGVWKEFDCYNLAAIGKTTNDDPFTPSWRLIGGYWQWGRKGPSSSQWFNTNTQYFAHGPTGPGSGDDNREKISEWDSGRAPNGAWSVSHKTGNDPCPSGFRLPTRKQWDGVLKGNTQRTVGTWSKNATNYSSARFFGNKLMLPAAGFRSKRSGMSANRGYYGEYWSSSTYGNYNAWKMGFASSYAGTYNHEHRRHGLSIRCIAE